jgi:hypothetical protein
MHPPNTDLGGIRTCFSLRVAACRSIRTPRALRRMGPWPRPSTARSIAPGYRRRQRDQHRLVALATNLQHTVAVLLAEVTDAGAAGFEDPQAEQTEHRGQSEVVDVGRQPVSGEQGFELQVSEPEGG